MGNQAACTERGGEKAGSLTLPPITAGKHVDTIQLNVNDQTRISFPLAPPPADKPAKKEAVRNPGDFEDIGKKVKGQQTMSL